MQTLQYTTIDKSRWPRGQWDLEPDKIQWQDKETGFPCLAVRHDSSGHWCGYVGVSEGHPAFQAEYDKIDFDVHGGLTFAASCQPSEKESHGICHIPDPGEADHVWWFGFDCHHSDDMAPADETRNYWRGGGFYRSLDYVQSQCAQLAEQLKKMGNL